MRLSLAAAQLSVGGKSTVKCFDALSSCQFFFFIITSVFDFSWVSYFLKVYLCFVMLPGFLPYVLLITAVWTWALVVGKHSHQRIQKEEVLKFSCKSKVQCVCVGVGLESYPGDSLLSGVVQCIDSCCWREYCSSSMSVFCIFIECKIFCYESHRCKQNQR